MSASDSTNPNSHPPRARVLLVEDDFAVRESGRLTLSAVYEVETCANGREALAAMALHPPDLVLTDLMMPELDGVGLLKAIRNSPTLHDLPVIFVSGSGTQTCGDALKAGADDFLTKPFQNDELLARVDARLEVAQRTRAERRRLRESEERMRLAVEIAQLGTFSIDLETGAVEVNEVGREIYGFAPGQQLTFTLVQSHFHPDDKDEVMRRVEAAFAPGGTGEFEVEQRIYRTDGALRWIRVHGRAIHEGEVAARCVGTYLDITQRKEVERVLRDADRRKDEFLAMLAHELRNPLAGIRTAIEVLATQADGDSRSWATGVVERQSAQLTRLVDDLLDVSRITSGKIKLRKATVDLAELLAHAVEVVRPLMQQRGHEFITEIDAGAPLIVEGDSTRLEQIVVNLLTNASKYTPAGGRITLGARNEGEQIAVTVQDNGMGIPPARVPEMFELFAQGERSIARSEGGLGLGLTIVKRLTQLHGGSVSAYSEGLGRGSTFTVRIPALAKEAAEARSGDAAPAAGKQGGGRVLVVDDNVDTATGMLRLLRARGYTVEAAFDGPTALEIGRQFRPGFVLLDIGLPGMSGYEVASRLRRDEACKDALLVAITGYGQGEDIRRSYQAGFNHHLVKPVDLEELGRLMEAQSSAHRA